MPRSSMLCLASTARLAPDVTGLTPAFVSKVNASERIAQFVGRCWRDPVIHVIHQGSIEIQYPEAALEEALDIKSEVKASCPSQ